MRAVGLVVFAMSSLVVAWSVNNAMQRRRPLDLVFALGGCIALLGAAIGLAITFAPGFLSEVIPWISVP